MKYQIFFIFGIIVLLFYTCKDPEPKGTAFAWSPDGKYLALEQVNSHELLLVAVGGNEIKEITLIDTMAEAPHWSHDGRYLLYYQKDKDKKMLSVCIYSMDAKQSKKLFRFNKTPSALFEREYISFWSPVTADFACLVNTNENIWRIHLVSADGSESKVLLTTDSEPLFIQWSQDGRWLYYGVNSAKENKNNGIWSVGIAGSTQKQLWHQNALEALQQSPDGSRWAYVYNSGEKEDVYRLVVTDANFQTVYSWYAISQKFTQIDWSPDGRQMICEESGENGNLWLAGFDSKTLLKVTFDDLDSYFGWQDATHYSYTVKYPEEAVSLTKKDEDDREIMQMFSDKIKLNQYFIATNRSKKRFAENIFAERYFAGNGNRAYYIAYNREGDLLANDEIYLPAVEFPDKQIAFLIRNPNEEEKMSHIYYSKGDYSSARASLVEYWKMKYQITDISNFLNFKEILGQRKIDKGKNYYELMEEEIPILLKMILIHRRLNDNETTNHLFSQLAELVKENDSWDNLKDLFSFVLLTTYIKYHAVQEGVQDMDAMMSWRPGDSLYVADLYFAQSFLIDVVHDRIGMLEKLKSGIAILPAKIEEKNLVTLGSIAERYKDDREIVSVILPLGDNLLSREQIENDVAQLLAEMYLTSGEREKAYLAYQKAVTVEFDHDQLWQKLFALKLDLEH
jgi:hypothetical protein